MATSRSPSSAVHRVKRRGSRVKPEVATVSLTRGVFGGERRARIETEREQSYPGEFPKTLTPCASVHRSISWVHLNLYSQTSIYVLLHIRTFDLCTNLSEQITLFTYSKFDLRTSLNVLIFNISTHNEYRSAYIKVRRSIGLHGDFRELVHQDWIRPWIPTLWECWVRNLPWL